MLTKKNLESEIENLIGLNDMVKSYEEIAASRIRRTRDSVLRNRTFVEEIHDIYEQVIFSYKKQVEELMKSKKGKDSEKFSFINKNGKTLYIFISANTGLYGNLIKRTFELFQKTPKDETYDIAIIGKLGLALWNESKLKQKFFYFDFPDQNVDEKNLDEILKFIINYQKTVVFYGQFQNFIKQNATFSDISGNALDQKIKNKESVKFFFEPSLEKILEFFEKQIFASIFEQTVRESQLAKIASRLTSLDTASENIDKQLVSMTNQKNRISHSSQNKKQLETFASSSLWGKV
ncbi:MAG: F0F1 ATP synthase subunit gamma [Candidatus Levybacteria bacterium]|nr:F0F1 ATP synthase subunit gamma [Candidatus Levybacteria bacterium]